MESVVVTAYPYATQYGSLNVPEGMSESEKQKYIEDHWNEIAFDAPDLDYCGTDFEFETVMLASQDNMKEESNDYDERPSV